MKILLSITAALVLFTSTAMGEEVTLQHKFVPGTRIITENTTTLDQVASVGEVVDESKILNTTLISTTVGDRQADGTLVADSKIDAVASSIDSQRIKMSYDSRKEDNSAALLLKPLYDAVANAKWQATYGKDNRVTKITGSEDSLKTLAPHLAAAIREQFEGEYLKRSLNTVLDQVPATPIQPNDTWTITQEMRFGLGQVMTLTIECKYLGAEEVEGRTIDAFEIVAKTAEMKTAKEAATPVRIIGSELQIAESSGKTLFDRELGLITSMRQTTRIEGTFTQEFGQQKIDASLDLTIDTDVKQRVEEVVDPPATEEAEPTEAAS